MDAARRARPESSSRHLGRARADRRPTPRRIIHCEVRARMRRRRDEKILRPVHANAGIRAAYRAKLCAIVDEMARSYGYWIKAGSRANPPRMALDAPPAQELRRDLRLLGKRWQDRLDEAAPRLALWVLKAPAKRADHALRSILPQGRRSVRCHLKPD